MKEIKLIEAFAGYGSQRMALRNLGYKISDNSAIIEWTIDAIIAYASVHHKKEFEGRIKTIEDSNYTKQEKIDWILRNFTLSTEKKKNENKEYVPVDEAQLNRMKEDFLNKIIASNMVSKNLGSIMDTKGEWIQYADIFTYSFPCQDLSLAGKMKGITETSRSGLLYQVERILKEQTFEQRPKVLLLENVKNLVGKKFMPDFQEWLKTLEELGYTTTWKVLNAREHGVPQNRERVFAVSIKNDQDITFDFNNIQPQQLDKRLKHYLEDKVDESFYLSDEHIQRILGWNAYEKPLKKVLHQDSIDVGTITTRSGDDTSSQKLVMDNVGHKENHINVEDILNGKNIIMGINPTSPVYKSDNIVHGENYYISTLRAGNGTQLVAIKDDVIIPLRIRKITPKEALRLMGVNDSDINNIFEHITSKGPQYKLAGNSIVVDVLETIFREIKFKGEDYE